MGELVASVAVDVPLAHLDRPFDYLVPEELRAQAVPGARVRVKFAGRQVNGFILGLSDASEHPDLKPLHAVVSAEPVLTEPVATLVRAVADHYAGNFTDVVRLAVPPRHGITEKADPPAYPAPRLDDLPESPLAAYPAGDGLLAALAAGGSPRAAWTVAPTSGPEGDWRAGMLQAAAATLRSGRGVIVVVPDQRDLAELAGLAEQWFGRGSFVTLSADAGPAARYRAFLAALRGQVRLVLGTRAAAFAPVGDLGLLALWDDGDDSHSDPHAPYPHAREVLALRAHQAGCGLLLAARNRTADVQRLVETGWLRPLALSPGQARAVSAAVRACPDEQRLPWQVFATIRDGLAAGPVLVSVPRAGYQPLVVCDRCREVARCRHCTQPLVRGRGGLGCRFCGPLPAPWRCAECGGGQLRAPVAGVVRTAEEFGKAFPGTTVLHSSGDHPLEQVADRPAIVLATPGVEPHAASGYAAAVLLDTAATLARPDLRAGEEALRRWLAVAALVRPGEAGGTVLLVGEPSDRQVQAMLRLDPVGHAERELAERRATAFPPAAKLVTIEGDLALLAQIAEVLQPPPGVELRGPFEVPAGRGDEGTPARLTVRSPLAQGSDLVAAVRLMLSQRVARKAEGALRVRVDPQVVG